MLGMKPSIGSGWQQGRPALGFGRTAGLGAFHDAAECVSDRLRRRRAKKE